MWAAPVARYHIMGPDRARTPHPEPLSGDAGTGKKRLHRKMGSDFQRRFDAEP